MAERITFDKPYDLKGEVSPRMISNIDEMLAQLYWSTAQIESKLSANQGFLSSQTTTLEQENSGVNVGGFSHWPIGPWTFGQTPLPGAYLDVGAISTGTYNNFEPSNIDYTVVLDIEPSGGTVTLTGLKSRSDFRPRLILIRNVDTSNNLVFKHLNSGSAGKNQFRLPSSTDVTVGARQAIWLFFDPSAGLWTSAITTHTSGGLSLEAGVTLATGTLTEAQIESWSSSPITLISAPSATTAIIPIHASVAFNITALYSSAPSFTIDWGTASAGPFSAAGTPALNSNLNEHLCLLAPIARNYTSQASFDGVEGEPIILAGSADPTGAGSATAAWSILYYTTTTAA